MSILKVARMVHPVLRAKARTVDKLELKQQSVQDFIDNMVDTMFEYAGVGLAVAIAAVLWLGTLALLAGLGVVLFVVLLVVALAATAAGAGAGGAVMTVVLAKLWYGRPGP